LWKKGGWTPGIPEDESDEKIKDLIIETEIEMKSFIIRELKFLLKEEWWEKGIPSGTKNYIKEIIKIQPHPFKNQIYEIQCKLLYEDDVQKGICHIFINANYPARMPGIAF